MKKDKVEFVTLTDTITKKSKKLDMSLHIRMTQEYMPEVNMGHYKYVIEDSLGNILKASGSCCCPPEGKIGKALLAEMVTDFWDEYQLLHK